MLYTIGDEVEFTTTKGKDIVLPKRLWLVQDRDGDMLERCWVFILPGRRLASEVARERQRWAEAYYGKDADIFNVAFLLPKGPFRRLCDVDEIRYRRGETAEFFHPFESSASVTIYKSPSENVYRLNLSDTDRCDVNDRGFIRP